MTHRAKQVVFTALFVMFASVFLGAANWRNLRPLLISPSWTREHPLANPIQVTAVNNGMISLADGRTFRPAGVSKRFAVTDQEFDHLLHAATAQGVEVLRDLGDGSAFLQVEPKFYNWCGTSSWYWAGSYFQSSLSQLVVFSRYGEPALDAAGLTARDRWLLEGAHKFTDKESGPTRINDNGALRYELDPLLLTRLSDMLEMDGSAPPKEP